MIVDELVAKIGLEFHGAEAVAKAVRSLDDFKGAVFAAAGVLLALKSGLEGLTFATAEQVLELEHYGEAVGISVQSLQALGVAAGRSGGNLEDVQNGLRFLANNAASAADGNETATAAFDRLGVSVYGANGRLKTVEQLLPDITKGFEKIHDPSRRVAVAMDVFGRGGLVTLKALQQVKGSFADFREGLKASGRVMSEETIERFVKVAKGFNSLGGRLKGLKNLLAEAFLPNVENLIDVLGKIFERATPYFASVAKHFAQLVAAPFELITRMLGSIPAIIYEILGLGAALTAVFLVPAVAIGLLAFLIAAISEDINAFLDGQESQIGEVVKEWQNFLGVIRDMDKEAEGLLSVFTRIGRVLADIAGFTFGGKTGRKRAFEDFLDATGINALGDMLQRSPELDDLASQGAIPSAFSPGLAGGAARVPAALLANPSGNGPAARAQRYREVVHAPQVIVNAVTGASAEDIARAAEDAIVRSAVEIESMTGARK